MCVHMCIVESVCTLSMTRVCMSDIWCLCVGVCGDVFISARIKGDVCLMARVLTHTHTHTLAMLYLRGLSLSSHNLQP